MSSRRAFAVTAAIAPFILFLSVYLPAAGRGFVRDDYTWVLRSRIEQLGDVTRVVGSDIGFYRPAVALTFSINEWMFGAEPRGYGITNVVLALACAAAIFSLGRALRLPDGAALFAAGLWLLQAGAMRASVLWISGRTALVVTLAATLSASALVRGRSYVAVAWLLIALFAKEEALLLPLVLFGWLLIFRRASTEPAVPPAAWLIAAATAMTMYAIARASTNAATLVAAPAFYRVTFDPGIVVRNAIAYGSQAIMVTGPILGLAMAALGRPRPLMTRETRAIVWCGALWMTGMYALTIWLPNRSELYGALPAVGTCLVAAAVCAQCWNRAPRKRQTRALVAATLVVAALAPVHVTATREWVGRGDFASSVIADLRTLVRSAPLAGAVVISDNRNDPHGNLASVFGTMAADACELTLGRRLDVWIDPPPPYAASAGLIPPCPKCVFMRLTLTNGRLQRIEPRQALGVGH